MGATSVVASAAHVERDHSQRLRTSSDTGKPPRMNSSERGKYYRRKYKEYEDQLDASVASLAKQVRHLEMLKRLRDELLAARFRQSIVSRVLQVVEQTQVGDLPANSEPPSKSPRFEVRPKSLLCRPCPPSTERRLVSRFQLRDIQVLGNATLTLALRGDVLIARASDGRRVHSPATLRLYFDADGFVQRHDLEVDEVRGLQRVLPSLGDVDRALRGARGVC